MKGAIVPRNKRRRTATAGQILLLIGISVSVVSQSPPASGLTAWTTGDVFVAVSNGSYKVYSNSGAPKETISDGLGGFTTGCAFDKDFNLYTTNFSANKVVKYAGASPHTKLQTIDTAGPTPGVDLSNESIVFDSAGNFYVGHADGTSPDGRRIHKYSAAGGLLATFTVVTEARGSDWIELAADQKTIFYTSEGGLIKRFDVSTGTQLADFANIGGISYALRLLPPGDGSGGLLVANTSTIKRLNSSGLVVQTYDIAGIAGEDSWFSLNLDPNGTSFWAGNFNTANFYRFNIATGEKEIGPINTGTGPSTLFGICVRGEPTAAAPPELALAPIGDKTVDEGVLLAFPVNATGGGETKTFTAFELPFGATFDSNSRQFNWTPSGNQAGKYFPCFQVTDGESFDVACPTVTVNNTIVDTDGDGVPDAVDNCPGVPNPDQSDTFGVAGVGDACDTQFVNTPGTTTTLNSSDGSYTVGQQVVMHACVTFAPTSPPSFVVRPDPFFVLVEALDSAGHEVPLDGLPERRGLALPGDLVQITTTQTLCTDIPVSESFLFGAGSFTLNARYVTVGVRDPDIVNGMCTEPAGCYAPILQTVAPAGSQKITVRDTQGALTTLADLLLAVGGLSDKGLSNSLGAKLRAAQASVLKGNPMAACGQLTAFNNEVAAQAGKKLSGDQAATFTSMANSVKNMLVCSA